VICPPIDAHPLIFVNNFKKDVSSRHINRVERHREQALENTFLVSMPEDMTTDKNKCVFG
jgi:hypothetical protein